MNFHHNSEKKNHIADFSDFHFSVMVKIHRKLTILSTKMIIFEKLKIWKWIFHSCQHISDLSCKFFQFWKKKCCSNFIENLPILSTRTDISRKNLKFNFFTRFSSVKNPNWIISHGTPDNISRHTSVTRHTVWKTMP